jgi:DNA repair exonuclease SbcCD ATPase subunit
LTNDESYFADAAVRFNTLVSKLGWPVEQVGWLRLTSEGDVQALDYLTGWIDHHRIAASKLEALEKAERQIDELRVRKEEIEKQIDEYSSEVKDAEPTTVDRQLKECRTLKAKQQESLELAQRAYWAEVTRVQRKCELEQRLLEVRQDEVDFRHLENMLAPPSRNSEGGPLLQRITRGVLQEVAARSSKVLEDWGQSTEVVIPADTLAFRVIDRAAGHAERHFQLFSGGEKFLVALAIAISIGEVAGATGHPDCLFIDEGFGLLDADNRARVAQEIVSRLVASGRRKQVVVITHMEDIQSAFTARYHLVNDGTATRLQPENEDDLS